MYSRQCIGDDGNGKKKKLSDKGWNSNGYRESARGTNYVIEKEWKKESKQV